MEIEKTLNQYIGLSKKLSKAHNNKEQRKLWESHNSGITGLAKKGILLCYADKDDLDDNNIAVVSKETVKKISDLARKDQYKFLPGAHVNVDDIFKMLDLYEQKGWGRWNLNKRMQFMTDLLRRKYRGQINDAQIYNLISNKKFNVRFNNSPLSDHNSKIVDAGKGINTRLLPGNNYLEWDATFLVTNELKRDSERFVTNGSCNVVYYTSDHYATFVRIN